MSLEEFGYNNNFEKFRIENNLTEFSVGRITIEHKERYIIKTIEGDVEAEITGNLRYTAKSREDFPAVGDWVALTIYNDYNAIIHKVFPRYSVIKREDVGKTSDIQIIAANVDYAFLVQAVDRDFNINRLERYLTICNTSGISPVILLTKTDLISTEEISEILERIKPRIEKIPVIPISNDSLKGYDLLSSVIKKGKTYCMLGSSGVGKSTLINNLSGLSLMKTDSISDATNKGKHVTTHRELIILDNGGILIDNPGMREVGIADSTEGLEITFDKIYRLSENCRFKDCTHTTEIGCSVIEAVSKGEINSQSYENYLKMQKEKAFFESTIAERRKKDKMFGKMVKNYKKDRFE